MGYTCFEALQSLGTHAASQTNTQACMSFGVNLGITSVP